MRILLLSVSYAPEPAGSGPYSADIAESLAQRGHEVRVVTTFPYFPAWRAEVPRGTRFWARESRAGVRVTRCRMYVPRTPRPLRRVVHELSWLATASPVAWRDARWADVCIVVSPAFAGALLGALLARFSMPAHLHVHDVVPDIAVESGQLRSPLARRAAIGAAHWAYGSYRSISVLSEGMRRRLDTYVDERTTTVRVIPNWVRTRMVTDSPRSGRVPFGSYAVFAGSLGEKQGLSSLTEAAEVLTARGGPGIVVLGDGPGRRLLQGGPGKLAWLGLVDAAEYDAVLGHAIAGIVTLHPGVGDSIVPSKLLGYMGSGLPVIVSADPESEAAQLVQTVGCGRAVPPGRGDLMADALAVLARDQAEQRAMGARGAAYAAREFGRDRCIDKFEEAIVQLVPLRAGQPGAEAQASR